MMIFSIGNNVKMFLWIMLKQNGKLMKKQLTKDTFCHRFTTSFMYATKNASSIVYLKISNLNGHRAIAIAVAAQYNKNTV